MILQTVVQTVRDQELCIKPKHSYATWKQQNHVYIPSMCAPTLILAASVLGIFVAAVYTVFMSLTMVVNVTGMGMVLLAANAFLFSTEL
jgi:hypothetical protein